MVKNCLPKKKKGMVKNSSNNYYARLNHLPPRPMQFVLGEVLTHVWW